MLELKEKPVTAGNFVTLLGVIVNIFLILFKFSAGVFGHSHALIADAVHSISDLFTDAVVLLGFRAGRKAPDLNHQFGHARIETLASAIVAITLIVTALYLGIKASWDIYYHIEQHPTWPALAGAAASVILKEGIVHYTVRVGKRIKSPLIVANAWHHRSDSLSSIAVFLGVTGAYLNPSWYMLDNYAALIVSFFIIKVGFEVFGDTLREFLDTAPNPDIMSKINQCACCQDGVIDVHDLRVRISGGRYQMETHIVVDGQLTVIEGHNIAKAVESSLLNEISDIERVIVHVDPAIINIPPKKKED